ncbi:MAG: chorismate-binding protein, partial [Verrucomicrobiota bacterium]
RPIAGTRPRAEDSAADLAFEKELLADPKEAAEHVMLVDLARNDLGRVAVPGSIRVDPYRSIERYSHVMHIVSGVKGVLRPGADQFDLFSAAFPAIRKDLLKLPVFLADNTDSSPDAAAARAALQSARFLIEQVSQAWQTWIEFQKPIDYQFDIEQQEGDIDPLTGQPRLAVNINKVPGPTGTYPLEHLPMPGYTIPGYQTHPTPPTSPTAGVPGGTAIQYTFSATGASGPVFLPWQDRLNHPIRDVGMPDLNVLAEENAWAGVGIVRNKDLQRQGAGFRPVNQAFIYETPLVRPRNPLNPFLDPACPIELPSIVNPPEKTIAGYLSAFFERLFENLKSLHVTTGRIKLGFNYEYPYNS